MTNYIGPGVTRSFNGTLEQNGTLSIQAGPAGVSGGQLNVVGRGSDNQGVIEIGGGNGAAGLGGTLDVVGVLTNSGVIAVGGGDGGEHGALLEVGDKLYNYDRLSVAAGENGFGGALMIASGATLFSESFQSGQNPTIYLYAGEQAGSTGATLTDAGFLQNTGTLTVGGGGGKSDQVGGGGAELNITGAMFSDGLLVVDGGRNAAGSGRLIVAGTLTNSGTLNLTQSSRNNASYGAIYHGGLLMVSGSLDNKGSITAAGGDEFGHLGSTIDVTGVLTNAENLQIAAGNAPPSFYLYPFGEGSRLYDSGSVKNSGTIAIGGNGEGFYPDDTYGYGGTLGVTGMLSSTGLISVFEAGLISIGASGTVASSGLIQLAGGSEIGLEFFGAAEGGAGATIADAGVFTNAGTIDMQGGRSSAYLSEYGGFGAQPVVSGVFDNNGQVALGGGHNIFAGEPLATGATLTVSGMMTNTGTILLAPGTVPSYSMPPTGGVQSGSVLIDSGVVVNDGLIALEHGEDQLNTELVVRGLLVGTGTIENAGVVLAGVAGGAATVMTQSSFENGGTVLVAAESAAVLTGLVGTLDEQGGVFTLGAGSALTLNDSVSMGEFVAFGGGATTLALGEVAAFAGTLEGIAATDVLDFLATDVVTATTAGTMLVLGVAGMGTVDVALGAPLAGIGLSLSGDGHGGTALTFVAASGHGA